MIGGLWQVTSRQWGTHRLRTLLTILGISLGVAVLFAVRTANLTLLNSLTVTVEKLAGKATLQVVGDEGGFPEAVWDTVRDTPGVRVAQPVIEVLANIAFADEGRLLIVGVDMLGDRELREYQFDEEGSEIADPLVALAQPDSILISRTFAEKYRLRDGDKLPLYTAQGRKEFVVRGIFRPVGVGEIFDGQIAVMDVFNAQYIFSRGRNIDRIDLMNEPEIDVDALAARIRARLPAGIEVTPPTARGQGIEKAVSAMRIGMLIASFIALLVGVFIIFNTFTIAVNQRWKEIGILRAIGVERRNIQTMFLVEALVMGIVGSLVGIGLGYLLAVGAERLLSEVAAQIFSYVATQQPPIFRADYALTSFAIGTITSLIGAWLPSRAATRLDPILALHNIEIRQRETVLGNGRLALGLLLIIAGLLCVAFAPLRVSLDYQFFYPLLMIAGLILILPKLAELIARLLRPLMDRVFGTEGVLAVESMIQSPRRTTATVGALMIGLSFVFSTASYVRSYQQTVEQWMKRFINADLIISTSEMARSRTYHFSEDLGRRIAAIPGVKRVENVRFLFVPYANDSIAVVAFEMEGWFARVSDPIDVGEVDEARRALIAGDGVLVSRNLTTRYGLGLGDVLTLQTPTRPFSLPIVGIIDDYTSEKGAVFFDRRLYREYWNDAAVDMIDVNVEDAVRATPGGIAAVRDRIQQVIRGEHRAFIYTNTEYRKWVLDLINGFFVINYMQTAVAVIIAALGIVNTLIISVTERRRELGVLRAVGGLRRQIGRMIMLEAAVMAVVGVISGTLAGMMNTLFLVRTAASMVGGFTIPFRFPVGMILLALPLTILISLLAAWWPARKAVNLNVVEAIGYE
ncbi:MAG: ABC transporter permease [Acidobacteria bacterium]|nr:ABC transporter permease [Acidobacteriota bacterium]